VVKKQCDHATPPLEPGDDDTVFVEPAAMSGQAAVD
jgi:hypothetical protein